MAEAVKCHGQNSWGRQITAEDIDRFLKTADSKRVAALRRLLDRGNSPDGIWSGLAELADAVQETYSVSGKSAIREQYLNQVRQYPLYMQWFDRVKEAVNKKGRSVSVLEYGPGPGLLAEMLADRAGVSSYTAIEPNDVFIEMTNERVGKLGKVVKGDAESYIADEKADIVVATASYHHFNNKPKALEMIRKNLKDGGNLIIADVFLPDYRYDANYDPVDKVEFVTAVLRYTAAQIMGMPDPKNADVADQVKTAILDVTRIGEQKVCLPILLEQLGKAGYKDARYEHMQGKDNKMDYASLMYYFVRAEAPL